jgi:hypothetical protein
MIFNKILRPLVITSSLLALGAAHAATDGTQGVTSTGSIAIDLTKTAEILISGLSDITLTGGDGSDATGSSGVCVFRNSAGTYNITASGSGAANAFTITDGTDTLDYALTFDDGTGAEALATGAVLPSLNNANTSSKTCDGATNGTIGITVAAADYDAAAAGTYNGTLTLLVAPE